MKKNIFLIVSFIFYYNVHSQNIFSPTKLRTDLLLNSNKVSKNGILVNFPLTKKILQDASYQFPKVYSHQPTFHWENAKNINKATAWRILVATTLQNLNNCFK